MQQYTLPDLAYEYGALEPYYSAEMLELHHDRHLAAYVAGANATLATIEQARHSGDVASYVDTIWNIINSSEVADRFAHVCHGS